MHVSTPAHSSQGVDLRHNTVAGVREVLKPRSVSPQTDRRVGGSAPFVKTEDIAFTPYYIGLAIPDSQPPSLQTPIPPVTTTAADEARDAPNLREVLWHLAGHDAS